MGFLLVVDCDGICNDVRKWYEAILSSFLFFHLDTDSRASVELNLVRWKLWFRRCKNQLSALFLCCGEFNFNRNDGNGV